MKFLFPDTVLELVKRILYFGIPSIILYLVIDEILDGRNNDTVGIFVGIPLMVIWLYVGILTVKVIVKVFNYKTYLLENIQLLIEKQKLKRDKQNLMLGLISQEEYDAKVNAFKKRFSNY